MPLKIATWNIEHADRLLSPTPTAQVEERRRRIRQTLEEIAPDILCMQEGPRGEKAAHAFANLVLNGQWVPAVIDAAAVAGANDSLYQTKGTQWVWFMVRAELAQRCRIQPPAVWQAFTEMQTWRTNLWGEVIPTNHSHYRHPQLMVYRHDDGTEIEVIGVHLKSKINQLQVIRDAYGNLGGDYVREALEARVKLATEARNIREYIAAKFRQVPEPGVVVLGDCNDGPGHDFFETQYLFFDLITNLQGDVMIAERFFNHALFDFPGALRWTARYGDPVTGVPASQNPLLLDHILISQPLCRGTLPLKANAGAGRVEHEAFERNNAGAPANRRTSDHRPVSCTLDDVVAG
jgi:endonuclease/exonuclease/phosphatase family metal-dependent hydrolase